MHISKRLICLCTICLSVLPVRAAGDDAPKPGRTGKLKWIEGPGKADIKNIAEIQLPEGFMFIGAKETQQILEANGNPTSGNELGLLAPSSRDWFVVFEFSDVGYVKDDDKDKLDADKLLADIKRGTAEANKERVKAGQPPLEQEPDQRRPLEAAEIDSLQSHIGEQWVCWRVELGGPAQDPLDSSSEAGIAEDRGGDPPHRHSFGGQPLNLGPLRGRRFRSLS